MNHREHAGKKKAGADRLGTWVYFVCPGEALFITKYPVKRASNAFYRIFITEVRI